MAGSVFAAEPGDGEGGDGASDSLSLRFPVRPTVAPDYESLAKDEFALDLDTPSNVVTEVEYDPESGVTSCAPKWVTGT